MQSFELLEKEWGEFAGNPNVVVCSSGTSALHIALEVLSRDKTYWDYRQVLLPDFTMIACARAVTMAGMRPTFIDCNQNDLLMDCNELDSRITNGSIVIPVHIYGRRCDMKSIRSLAERCHNKIVEDMAEIHGVLPDPFTDAACWSFYRNKIVAGEEGGAMAFKDPEDADLARQLRSLGFTDVHDFNHVPRGINARLSNANAEAILRSLGHYEDNVKFRRAVEEWYNFHVPEEWHMPKRDAVWVYDVRLPVPDIVGPVVRDLNDRGIAARQSFKPMSSQSEYQTNFYNRDCEAYQASREIMYLPVYPGLTEEGVRSNAAALREAVLRHTPSRP